MNINKTADEITKRIYEMLEEFKNFSDGGTTAYLKAATELNDINKQIISMYEREAVNVKTLNDCEIRVKNILNNLSVPVTEKT